MELKPCPFCGRKHINVFMEDWYEWRCECDMCRASTRGRSQEAAEEAWNRRVGEGEKE